MASLGDGNGVSGNQDDVGLGVLRCWTVAGMCCVGGQGS